MMQAKREVVFAIVALLWTVSGGVFADPAIADSQSDNAPALHGQAYQSVGEPVGPVAKEVGDGQDLDRIDETTILRAIGILELITDDELHQVLSSLFTAIANQPEESTRKRLAWALDDKLAQLARPGQIEAVRERAQARFLDAVRPAAGEQESLQALVQKRQQLPLTEEELREQIDALTLDPKRPEIGLTRGMEIAGLIDRLEDPQLQGTLRDRLTRRLVDLQANCTTCE